MTTTATRHELKSPTEQAQANHLHHVGVAEQIADEHIHRSMSPDAHKQLKHHEKEAERWLKRWKGCKQADTLLECAYTTIAAGREALTRLIWEGHPTPILELKMAEIARAEGWKIAAHNYHGDPTAQCKTGLQKEGYLTALKQIQEAEIA